jgi:hypothetical protein
VVTEKIGRVSKEGGWIIVNNVEKLSFLPSARSSDRIDTERRRFWNERERVSLSDEGAYISRGR